MRIVLAATFAAYGILPASAADFDALRPSIAGQPETTRTIDWSGPQFGLTGGGDLVSAEGSKFTSTNYFPGARLGAFAGYQEQFGNNVVLGVEGDVSYTWNRRDDYVYYSGGAPLGDEKIKTDFSGAVRARVGYAFDNLLIYATGGWVATRGVDVVQDIGTTREILSGYTLGAGVDYAFSDGIFGRIEYRYNDFAEKTSSKDGSSIDLQQHVFNVGVGMKF